MNAMGKEASLEGLEFDGDTVLCRVCGDKASGFHYGVHACEGCKGFFRRSIQQKIQYRPCLKNQQCNIMRVNRNRCQYCRLKKCISVGMSRDAVRFGRVPKKEKARIIEQMQKVNSQSQSNALSYVLQNEQDVVLAVVSSHQMTCDLPLSRVSQMREMALQLSNYINCPANMACPLNNHLAPDTNKNDLHEFSESFTPAIKSVVDFAKGIPGFTLLNQDDQVTLLKAGTFEVLLVRLACLFDPESNTMMFTGGRLFRRHPSTMTTGAGFLLDSMFDFAERFNKLCLKDEELALFSAIVLLSPDRPGLRNMEQVERIQNKLTHSLQNMINLNHKEDSTLFAKLLMKTTDLRTLNTLHSEKSIGQSSSRSERRERRNTEESDMDYQDSNSAVSGQSSPTPSDMSSMTMSGSFSDTCSLESGAGSLPIRPQRIPLEAAAHQQVVLRTPYGTFYREEMSGFYSLVADQPRRRCNTVDRDTLTRPRLHTIEEGNRRRYTLDRDYINKMVNRLSDKLEKRTAIRGEGVSPSIPSSTASSPIPEEYGSVGNFIPISSSEQTMGMSCTSPIIHPDSLMAQVYGSSPTSPRQRTSSFSAEEYQQQRRRCYSFHLNSEGRASRLAVQQKMLADREHHSERLSPEAQQYLLAEQRRGSVGTPCGLHARKRSLLVDRHPSYLTASSEGLGHNHTDKRFLSSTPNMQHMIPETSMYGMGLVPGSLSPNLLQRRGVLPPSSLGISSPSSAMSRPSAHGCEDRPAPTHSEVVFPCLSKVEEVPASTASATITSKDIIMDTIKEVHASSNPGSPRGSDRGSPQLDSEGQNETFGHKKFDKFRKPTSSAAGEEGSSSDREQGDAAMVVEDRPIKKEVIDVDIKEEREETYEKSSPATPPGSGNSNDSSASEASKGKRSAKESHPNLLAFLNSPAQVSSLTSPSSMAPPPSSSFSGLPWSSSPSEKEASISSISALLTPSADVQHCSENGLEELNVKDEFHASTVSSLKEKLLRKFDSSENLHKPSGSGTATTSHPSVSSESDQDHEPHNRLKDSVSSLPSTPPIPPGVLIPPGLHPAVYHSMLASHYALQGLRPPVVTTQHLAGLQQQFAQLFAASSLAQSPLACPLGSSVKGTIPNSAAIATAAAMAASDQRMETSHPLNLTAKTADSDKSASAVVFTPEKETSSSV